MAARVLVSTKGLPRDEWLEWRRKGIGGSDAPAMFPGLHPWVSPLALYLDKTGEVVNTDESEAMYWGSVLEPAVADRFAAEHPELKVRQRHAILRHAEHDWMLCNADRVLGVPGGRNGLLEIKTVHQNAADGWQDDQVPNHVMLQWQWSAAVMGAEWGHIAVLIGGRTYREYAVVADQVLQASLMAAGEAFWQRVIDRDPPLADGHDSTTRALSALYQGDPGAEVELPEEARDLWDAYHDAMALIREGEQRKDAATNRIRQLMGEATEGMFPGFDKPLWTWRPQTTTRFNQKAHEANAPECHAKHKTPTESRVLRAANKQK